MPKKYSASIEDYIEAVFQIIQAKRAVRVKDIAKRLGVSNASVTNALHMMKEKSLINYKPYDVITLTQAGEEAAKSVIKRHETVQAFLERVLGLKTKEAEIEACKIEHAISPLVLKRLGHFMGKIDDKKTALHKAVFSFKAQQLI
jgi:DtxR family Mn-dependent transcriptional regulator